jgi:hypothetical protein
MGLDVDTICCALMVEQDVDASDDGTSFGA